jgi:outer membrane protein assembly factor BamE
MRMPLSLTDRTRARSGALCLIASIWLAGCASKNPLMEEPAPSVAAANQMETAATASGVSTSGPSGLSRFLGFFSPYRIDIQQGNFVSSEMVAPLKEGLQRNETITPEQVRFVLGTPLLTDIFHANRWDYVFRLKKGNGEVLSSRVTVYFKDDRLVNIESDGLPTEQEYLALIAGSAPGNTPDN